jgi:hypothetical protein
MAAPSPLALVADALSTLNPSGQRVPPFFSLLVLCNDETWGSPSAGTLLELLTCGSEEYEQSSTGSWVVKKVHKVKSCDIKTIQVSDTVVLTRNFENTDQVTFHLIDRRGFAPSDHGLLTMDDVLGVCIDVQQVA